MSRVVLQQTLADCARLAQGGQLNEAARRCRELISDHPQEARAQLLLGMIEAGLGHLEEAESLLERALKTMPGEADGWYNLALLYQQRGQLGQAKEAYQKSLDAAPAHLAARVNLAHVLERSGEVDQALAQLDAALSRQGGNHELHVARGSMLVRAGRVTEAIAELEPLTESDTCPPGVWLNLGIALARAGLWQRAIGCYESVLKSQPDHPAALLNLGKAMAQIKDFQAAEAVLRRAVVQLPEHADAHSSLSTVLSHLGQFSEAEQHIRRAIDIEPRWAQARFNLAALYSKRTRPEDLEVAERAARAALEISPEHSLARHCLAIVLDKLGRSAESLQQARAAFDLVPDSPEFSVTLADLLDKTGDLEAASRVLTESRTRLGATGDLARQHGIVLLKKHQPSQALRALDDALAEEPADQRAIAHRAVALQWLERGEEASRYLGLERYVFPVEFPLPDGFEDIVDFNRALAADIRSHSELRWEPIGLAARNGALTEELLADRTPAILGFDRSLRQAIWALRESLDPDPDDPFLQWLPPADFHVDIWATLCGEGGNIDTHIHEQSWLSGAYYVELPELGESETDPAGWIEFGRPHSDIPLPPAAEVRLLRPREGLLVLFPSYLFHRTIPHRGNGDRISVSFDLGHAR